ncbi:glycoside hydrolase family 99-like domain-containing protein [Prevotella sp. RM4]|uniref:glycosyltransferase WbsX family protein n=1 Tax=Prevotella sp. RM4 TaxID=1200547 RepID=UPI0018DDB394|nr:glycoside hydrolase family 99-like domain-containing protein [Prevotella sp. RM4]
MNKNTKIFAMYLPQFHCIPENDEFWGKDFTDWVTVKNAVPLFEGHQQPRVPYNGNYYDLSLVESVEWQSKVASDYGVYGFGVYHYWFNNEKNLLTRPAEIMRDSTRINTKYFFIWDNCNWKRSWSNVIGNDWAPIADEDSVNKKGPQILIPYILGKESDWRKHYEYVRSHFISKNYEKKDNKPVFGIIWHSKEIERMCNYWDALAREDGFDGMCFVFKYDSYRSFPSNSYQYNYEPHHAAWANPCFFRRVYNRLLRILNINTESSEEVIVYDYDSVWLNLLKSAKRNKNPNLFHGAFVDYDDSPRRGRKHSRILIGGSPEKFEKYLIQLISISKEQNKDYIFLTAWNEWGESAYMEPDENRKYSYLQALKAAINNSNSII